MEIKAVEAAALIAEAAVAAIAAAVAVAAAIVEAAVKRWRRAQESMRRRMNNLKSKSEETVTMLTLIDVHDVTSVRAKWLTRIATFAICLLLIVPIASADDVKQQVFPTPEAAGSALVAAAKADDMKALSTILGPDADQIISSGDPVADNNGRDNFVSSYNEMHRYAYDDDGKVSLIIGAQNWPTPIPLIKKDGGWIFDTAAAKDELLYRRIGRNEIFTIKVLRDLVDGQNEYAASKNQFAEKILSDPGQQNGLYWAVAPGEPESPIGPLVASATVEGYKRGENGTPTPFHGYYYRILDKQGRNAPGGAKRYIVDGKMTNGFAFVAYPAEYRASGVMTFMVNQDGVVVQKDLGAETSKHASAITEYNPDKTWDEVVDQSADQSN